MKKFLITCFLGLSIAAAGAAEKKRHLLIFVGENNLAGARPAKNVLPALKKVHPLSKNEFKVAEYYQSYLPTTTLDKAWKSKAEKPVKVRKAGRQYENLLRSVKRAASNRKFDTISLFWYQGASDARADYGKEYFGSVQRVVTRLEKDLDQGKINVVLTRLTDAKKESKRFEAWETVRKSQDELADKNKGWEIVDTDEFNGPGNKARLTSKGYKELSAKYAEHAITFLETTSK